MQNYIEEKKSFLQKLQKFAFSLTKVISENDACTIKGFIDIYQTIYPISSDTKVISKLLEIHLFPHLVYFAKSIGYEIELAAHQNWYPDFTFTNINNPNIKFAVDLKTTYRNEQTPNFCNGFTLGSHGEYFRERNSTKNIQYPYKSYSGHLCLGVIYSRASQEIVNDQLRFVLHDLSKIPSVIGNFIFFAEEKWRIASDKSGSGNTANIGSIHSISDIINGNGVFAKAGEEIFDDYWRNYGLITTLDKSGCNKKITTLEEYLKYRGLPAKLNNKASLKKAQGKEN